MNASTQLKSHAIEGINCEQQGQTPKPSRRLLFPGLLRFGATELQQPLLVDNGADGNYIEEALVKHIKIPIVTLQQPIPLFLADGKPSKSGFITKETSPIQLHIGSHIETISFLITTTSQSIILGPPMALLPRPKNSMEQLLRRVKFPRLPYTLYRRKMRHLRLPSTNVPRQPYSPRLRWLQT